MHPNGRPSLMGGGSGVSYMFVMTCVKSGKVQTERRIWKKWYVPLKGGCRGGGEV